MKDWLKIDKVTIFKGNDENGNRYLSQFLKDYQQVFKPDMINAGCDRCLEDYYQKLIKYLSTMSKDTKQNSGYSLKPKYEGIPLEFGSRIQVSNKNLTDEMAEKLLKNHPKGKDLFQVIPEKTKQAPAPEKTRLEVLEDLKRPELNDLASSLGLNPEDYPNKTEISKAIEVAEKEGNTETGTQE